MKQYTAEVPCKPSKLMCPLRVGLVWYLRTYLGKNHGGNSAPHVIRVLAM